MEFELDAELRERVGRHVIDRINEYYASLSTRPVHPPVDAPRPANSLASTAEEPLPETGGDPIAVVDALLGDMIDNGFHTPSANYFGLQNPTPTYMSVIGEAIVAALNPQLASIVHSEIASRIEHETVHWIGDRVGWNRPYEGTFTSGGSEANFTALALALAAHFPQSVEHGLASIGRRPVLYCTAEAHHSIDKATSLLGLGRNALRRIAVTPTVQLDVGRLEAQILQDKAAGLVPFCVVATAGTTSSGAVDDIVAIANVCDRHGLWLHADAAYGGGLLFSNKHRHLIRGIERADSITMDPHKWLATSMSAGVVLTRHPETLWNVFAAANPFMPKMKNAALVDNFNIGLQWSRRMNSLKLWLTLKVHGRAGYEALIDRQITLARDLSDWIEASDGFELATPTLLPGLIYRVRVPNGSDDDIRAANEAVVRDVNREGQRWISTATVAGRPVIRTLMISYLTRQHHVDALKEALTVARERYFKPVALRA